MSAVTEIRFFKTNTVEDPGFVLATTEVARQFWASDDAQEWLTKGGMLLERLALNWVNENIGAWENVPADWEPIYDAIHAAMPRKETSQ
jgi:hypothetical protein